jgi:hypothetical protein
MGPLIIVSLGMFVMSFAILTIFENDMEFVLGRVGIMNLYVETLIYLPVVICVVWAVYFMGVWDTDSDVFILPPRVRTYFTLMQMIAALLFAYCVHYFSIAWDIWAPVLGSALIAVGGLLFVLGSLLAVYYFNGKRRAEYEKCIAERYVEQQRQYFELLLRKEEETRRYRHDVTSQLAQLQYYHEHGETEKMAAFMDQMLEGIRAIGKEDFNVGNEVVNAMLNYHLLPLRERGCRVSVRGMMPANMHIPELDLCVIISNLLQNATEAVQGATTLRSQWIDVDIRTGMLLCCVRVCNSTTNRSLKPKNPVISSLQ